MNNNTREYIAILLWQEDHRGQILNLIKEYCLSSNNLDIVLATEIPLAVKGKKNYFIRSVYKDEIIPDDNPKITSNANVFIIVIKDSFPVYEEIYTGTGKTVNANINGIRLKRYVRKKYHWKYIHSTDSYKEFVNLILLLRIQCNSESFKNKIKRFLFFKKIKVNIKNIFYSYNGKLSSIKDSPHLDYIRSKFDENNKPSSKYFDYNNAFEKQYGTNYGRSNEKFDSLIEKFDYKKYNDSEDLNLLKASAFCLCDKKYKNLVKGASLSNYLKNITKISNEKLLLDYFMNFNNQYISPQIYLILEDGLHRAALLNYFGIKRVNVLIFPINYEQNILYSSLNHVPFTNFLIDSELKAKRIDFRKFHKNYAGVFQ